MRLQTADSSYDLNLAYSFGDGIVQLDAGAHRGAERDALDVPTLRSRRLGPDDARDHGSSIVDQLLRVERELAHRDMHESGLVRAELNLTSLDLFDCAGDVGGDGA